APGSGRPPVEPSWLRLGGPSGDAHSLRSRCSAPCSVRSTGPPAPSAVVTLVERAALRCRRAAMVAPGQRRRAGPPAARATLVSAMTSLPLVFDAPRRARPPRHLADLSPAERRAAGVELGEPPYPPGQPS